MRSFSHQIQIFIYTYPQARYCFFMTRTASPLRYPGGKSALHNLVSDIIHANGLDGGHYAEPFAGGGGLALSLLFEGIVREIHLNDIDPAIAAFWRAILEQNDELCAMIETTPVTIEQWHDQKKIYMHVFLSNATICNWVLRLYFLTEQIAPELLKVRELLVACAKPETIYSTVGSTKSI